MNLKIGKVFTSKFVGTGPSFYKKIIYRAVVSQMLRNTDVESQSSLIDVGSQGGLGAISSNNRRE